MTSTLPNKQTLLVGKLKEYLHNANQRVLRTPERSLEVAYQSVLKIKAIEEEYLNCQNHSSDESANEGSFLQSFMRADVEKHVNVTKLRLAEFKASCFVLGNLSKQHLAKLRTVEEVLSKYTVNQQKDSPILQGSLTTNDMLIESGHFTDKTGVLPRSIGITINKIKNDFNPRAEEQYVKKFRSSRAKAKVAVKFLLTLMIVPFLTQHISKQFLIHPIIERTRGANHSQVFLNEEMKESAFRELKNYEESLQFNTLVRQAPALSPEEIEEKLQHKAFQISQEYSRKSSSAISNLFADMLAFLSFGIVLLLRRKEIIILKSFMDDIVYGLSDSAKAFIIILFTDVFVGFHSPHGWEVILEGIASHLGLPANRSVIYMFIATFPVILDTILKYWIFRYLSRISPSAVATLRNMNE